MPIALFELCCVVIVLATLAILARTRPPGVLLADYAALALAAWIGEESCVGLYRFYGYAEGWHARVDLVPALVPLIWPLVILSARDVVTALGVAAVALPAGRRDAGRERLSGVRTDLGAVAARAAAVGALVMLDASLVEVIAVRAGLWSWAEGGHLGVPLVGILGWGFFAAAADAALGAGGRARHALVVVLAPLATHVALLAAWWGGLRWLLRGPLGDASVAAVAVVGLVLGLGALALRRRGRAVPLAVAAPRMVAAALFVAELLLVAPTEPGLLVHTAAVALPYFVATDLRRARPPRRRHAPVSAP
jgi:hypothetical protein